MKFDQFGLHESLLEAISYMGFEKASPIQQKAIPYIMEGNDLVACAQTGTGKTAAFLLPVIHHMIGKNDKQIYVLILVPTRELALQIDNEIQGIGYSTDIDSLAVYGGDNDGMNWLQQKRALSEGANIIVATPGKLLSHLKMGYVNFENIKYLILDEADRMLDIGFYDDIKLIISHIPKKRQTLMFSATMPTKIRQLAKEILNNPKDVSIAMSKPAEGVLQAAYLVHEKQKISILHMLIDDKPQYNSILIFCATKKKVHEIARSLKRSKYNVAAISSDLEQVDREKMLLKFKSKEIRVLVATDVLSRGIDVKDINLVINFDVPSDAEDYVHRVGRTARASTTGVALTFINEDDMHSFHKIEKLIEREVHKIPVPNELGAGPEWKLNDRKPNKKKFNSKGKFQKKSSRSSNTSNK